MKYKCYYCNITNKGAWWCNLQLTPNDNCKEFKQNENIFKTLTSK